MSEQLLAGASSEEKTAYLVAIASIATADHSASDEEVQYLSDLSQQAGLTEQEQEKVIYAAKDAEGAELQVALDHLKNSELKYSLVTDLIAFAKSDNEVDEGEKSHIAGIAKYLNIDAGQLDLLNKFVEESAQTAGAAANAGNSQPQGFGNLLQGSGLGSKMEGAGINFGSLTKGLLGMIGPMLLGKLLSGRRQGSGGGLGGLLSGGGGGLGSLLSGGSGGLNAGLGSLLGGLGKSGNSGGMGGLLSKFLR